MTPDQITALVASGESEILELKATTGTRREATATVCAMLNHSGGHVLFGVTPNGAVVGQEIGNRTLEDLSAKVQRIDPPVYPEIERIPVSLGREVIAIRVRPGASPPYQYRNVSYRRVGNTTQVMSNYEYKRLLFEKMHAEQRWENQPATEWTVDDLDLAEIRNTISEAVRIGRLNEPVTGTPEVMLQGLGLMRAGTLYRAAVVLFGKMERLECDMPQSLLRVARFVGTDRSEFLDNRQFIGNAFTLLGHAERFLRETLPIASRFESGRMQRIDDPLYPPLATREAIANALCHRDYAMGGGSIGLAVYDDRLEVTSTGPLHFGLTPEDLFRPHESRPWNPLIARTFYRRGIIEEWGRGTIKMTDLATSVGLPCPEIEQRGDCVTIRFRRSDSTSAPQPEDGLTGQQEAVITLLRRSDTGLPLREIGSLLNVKASNRQLRSSLASLKGKGLVVSTGYGRGARWKAT